MAIRIHCSDHNEADAVWRAWLRLPDAITPAAEIHVDGHGLVCSVQTRRRCDDSSACSSAGP